MRKSNRTPCQFAQVANDRGL